MALPSAESQVYIKVKRIQSGWTCRKCFLRVNMLIHVLSSVSCTFPTPLNFLSLFHPQPFSSLSFSLPTFPSFSILSPLALLYEVYKAFFYELFLHLQSRYIFFVHIHNITPSCTGARLSYPEHSIYRFLTQLLPGNIRN